MRARPALSSEARSVPSIQTEPAVGASRPPARVRRVDLPEPEGPITATSSPGWARKVTLRRACTSVAPAPWTRETAARWKIGRASCREGGGGGVGEGAGEEKEEGDGGREEM